MSDNETQQKFHPVPVHLNAPFYINERTFVLYYSCHCDVLCRDCGKDTFEIHESYMLDDDVWNKAIKKEPSYFEDEYHPVTKKTLRVLLCIGCVEKRIGRLLVPGDFPDFGINDHSAIHGSERIRHRLGKRDVLGALPDGD
jgi:hypothetical protein